MEMTAAWEQHGIAPGEVREIIGAVDETFLAQMMLVFLDVPTGSLLLEEVAEDRPYATWKALGDERLTALGTGVLSLVSDRATALIQLAEKGLQCLRLPDFFPRMHDLVQSYSLALARQVSQAHKALLHAEEVRAKHPGLTHPEGDDPQANAQVVGRRAEVQHWEEAQRTYRQHLEPRSLTCQPFALSTALPQTSAQVASRFQAGVDAIEACAERHHVPARPGVRKKVRTQVPALATLVDWWWQGVYRDLEPCALSPSWRRWV
jgi:hypothetical protein